MMVKGCTVSGTVLLSQCYPLHPNTAFGNVPNETSHQQDGISIANGHSPLNFSFSACYTIK